MSVYVKGIAATAPAGAHFHINNVAFAFLWDFCAWVSTAAAQIGDYYQNDGEGMDATGSAQLAFDLRAAIADGRVVRFAQMAWQRGGPEIADLVRQFAEFCEASGGFEIW